MKKYGKIIGAVFISLIFMIGNTNGYDQVFDSVKLRHTNSYIFGDKFENNTNNSIFLSNTETVDVIENDGDFNHGSKPYFADTQRIINDGYIVSPNSSVQFLKATSAYKIHSYPVKRAKDNLAIVYTTEYYEAVNGAWQGPFSHTEYQPYEITWCGDGIKDDYTDEETGDVVYEACDPGDTKNKEGWGKNGGTCSNTCKPVNNPDPAVCTDIDVKPVSGTAPVTSNISCTGENASSYKIQIKDGTKVLKTVNSKTTSYTFSKEGNYTAQCYVDKTITSKACKQSITVDKPIPPVYDLALVKKVDGKKSGYKLDENVTFAITVTNQGNAVVNNFTITDYIPAGLELVSNNWSVSGNKATRQFSKTLNKGDSHTESITFKIVSDSNLTIKNFAEISDDDGQDCDSTTDNTNGNGAGESTDLVDNSTGTGCDDTADEDDHDVAVITLEDPVYDLALVKKLSAESTGPFKSGDNVTFDIFVSNEGTVDANEITITDYIPAGLELNDSTWSDSGDQTSKKMYEIFAGETKKVTITFKITQTTAGTIKNFAEISDDDGEDCDSYTDTDNGNRPGESTDLVDDASGEGCDDSGDEDDHDVAELDIVDTVYDLALTKTLSSLQDTFSPEQNVRFIITLENQGNVSAIVKEIVDYIPTGLVLNDTNWTQDNDIAKFTQDISLNPGEIKTVEINFTIETDFIGAIKNFAEISEDDGEDCDSTTDSDNGTDSGEIDGEDLEDDQVGTGCEQAGDEDDHDIEIITVVEPSYDLALRKVVASTGPFNTQDSVTFTITVFNQGTIDSGEVEITDYIPTGLTLDDTNWTQSGSIAVRTISNILAGENTPLDITFTIDSDAPKNIDNFAEISDDSGEDCDSFTDNINGNTSGESTGLVDDEIGDSCNEDGDEDDHDIAPIVIEDGEEIVPACNTISASPNSAQGSSLTTTLSCVGTGANTYRIEVKDEAGNIVKTVNAATGEVTLDRGTDSTANFTAKCFVNNTITSNTCEQTLQISSGGTGGGNPAVCLDIIETSTDVFECIGNSNANSISMRCGTDDDNNTVYLPTQEGVLGTDGRRSAGGFSCTDSVPKCIVRKVPNAPTPTNENNWVDSAACEYTAPVCGDGIVNPATESCDAGINNGKSGFACTNECTIPGGGNSSGGNSSGGVSSSGGGTPDCDPLREVCSITTTPTGGEIVFGPFGSTVVGHAKNVLASLPQYPFIQNTSEYDYSFEELCVRNTSDDNSVYRANNELCVDISNKMLYGYEKLFIAKNMDSGEYEAVSQGTLMSGNYTYPEFVSNKDAILANADYGSATLTTSIKDDIDRNGTVDDLYNAYFAANLDVRVAKPTIATIGGGVSYVKNGSQTTGDIKKITQGVSGFDDNTNFVGVSVSDSGVSSAVETNTSSEVLDDTEANTQDYTDDVIEVTDSIASVVTTTVSGFDKFTNFNGLDNVYVITDKNITLAELPASVNTPSTYIVEGGNLTLTEDIATNENIAFVVKGGNIIVEEDVEELSGTYISIPVDGRGGKIISESSSKQLVVYGSLLGNLQELVTNRYYIEKTGGQLSVGTIVSFGSRLLSKPAPLVAQFKSEYNASQKVAQ